MNNPSDRILHYLQHEMPAYPFDPDLDTIFVNELLDDFQHLDILEETKAFRWYHDNQPEKRYRNLRLALRRWIANAWTRYHA